MLDMGLVLLQAAISACLPSQTERQVKLKTIVQYHVLCNSFLSGIAFEYSNILLHFCIARIIGIRFLKKKCSNVKDHLAVYMDLRGILILHSDYSESKTLKLEIFMILEF